MPVDYQMLRKGTASLGDYQRLQEEFDQKKALNAAEIAKAAQIDADKLGEQAFMKAAMGQALTPQEQAAAQLMDAKSGGMSFNPVTGEMLQKPRISDRIGLPGMKPQGGAFPAGGIGEMSADDVAMIPAMDEGMLGIGGSGSSYGAPAAPQIADPYEKAYKENMALAGGNPKLQQQITADYMKSRAENEMKLKGEQDTFNRAVGVKQDALTAVNRLLANKNLSRATGGIQEKLPVFLAGTVDARADLDYVRNLMTTENLGLLKGVLSDTDMKILASIGSGELSGSDERVRGALQRMQLALSAEVGQASPYVSATPGQTPIMSGMPKVQGASGGGNDVQSLIDRYAQ